jgi:hypothetical protein
MVLGLLAALQACTTMSPKECRNANWRDVGLRDGLAGEPLTVLDARSKDCAETNVVVNVPLYLEGRNRGLPDYCRLDNAARIGLSGKAYHGVCAPGIDAEYRRRHAVGLDVYRARADLRGTESRRRLLEDRLVDARTDEERRRARDDLRDLDYAARRARDRLRQAEWALDQLR